MSLRVVPRRAAGLAIALAAGAAPLAAQGPGVFEVFASRQQSPSTPLLGGISLGTYHGAVGLRFSGAVNLTSANDTAAPAGVSTYPSSGYGSGYGGGRHGGDRGPSRQYYQQEDGWGALPSIGAWSADVDLIFAPVRPVPALRALLLGFSPYAFAGLGGYGEHLKNRPDTSSATWSLGAGAHHELLGWLGVGAEARYRQAFGSDSGFSPTWQDKLQYRVGLTVSFGGKKRSKEPESVVVVPAAEPASPCERAPCPTDDAAAARMRDPNFISRLLDYADGFVGTRYAAGGASPRTGFDAPGFVRYVYGEQGLRLPATVRDLATIGTDVSTRPAALRAGDLLFFSNDGSRTVDHVAIYAGRDRIIHSTASGNGVRYDTLGEGARGQWFADHLVSARRVITDAGSTSAPRDGDTAPPETK